jgi:hypothetical protein
MLILWLSFIFIFREIMGNTTIQDSTMRDTSISKKRDRKVDNFLEMKKNANMAYISGFYNQIGFLRRELMRDLDKRVDQPENKQRLEQERENDIYRKYLASRVKSSLAYDFLTMRYKK